MPVERFRNRLGACAISVLLALSAVVIGPPVEAAWPDKPVKVVVPFAPGGSSDIFARTIQKVIGDKKLLSQPLTVINVGGHFSVGAIQVKNAAPDGYNFLLIHPALMIGEVVSPDRKLSYRDFEPVALTGGFCTNYIVREDSPWKTLKDFVEAAKAKPGEIVAGVNIGALNHMAASLLERAAGIKLRYAQIGGGAENYAGLKGGTTQFIILSTSEYQTYKGGGIRALALAAPARHPMQADVPTAKEAGFAAEFCVNSYWFAPKGTPKDAIDRMAAALEAAMKTPEVKEAQDRQASTVEFVAAPPSRNISTTRSPLSSQPLD